MVRVPNVHKIYQNVSGDHNICFSVHALVLSAGRSARIVGVVGRPEHGPRVDLVELASASRPVLLITFASEGVARKSAPSMGNNPVLRRAPKQVCPECQSQGRYRLSAAAQADRLARFQRMLLPATIAADACPQPASSENFRGLKFCDNTHNIVTTDTILILYNKMKTMNNKINNEQ
jgi:hypothetical protein